MMNKLKKRNRRIQKIAIFLAFNMLIESVSPAIAMALTGGPSQPEVESFEPVGTTQMVDLFTGDFNYNIPLLDVGGYPINMAYHAGIGMEQEASWVGLGWNINPGAITRGMRGLPDDFDGDEIVTEFNIKPNRSWGVSVGADLSVFGMSKKKLQDKKDDKFIDDFESVSEIRDLNVENEKLIAGKQVEDITAGMLQKYDENISQISEKLASINSSGQEIADIEKKLGNLGKLNLTLGVTHNNYRGVGLTFNISSSIFGKIGKGGNIGLGINSQTGSNISFRANIRKKGKETSSVGLNYNSLSGLKSLSVSNNQEWKANRKVNRTIPVNLQTYSPSSQMDMLSSAYSLRLTFGTAFTGLHGNITTDGYYSEEDLKDKIKTNRAFGYFNNQHTASGDGLDRHALMDFNRSRDETYNKFVTQLPMAFPTYDVFSISGQGTGGMYRAYNNNVPVFYDADVTSSTRALNPDLNLEFGVGNLAHTAGGFKLTHTEGRSGAWQKKNKFASTVNDYSGDPLFERYHLKMAGELTPDAQDEYANWGGAGVKSIKLDETPKNRRNQQYAVIDESENVEALQFRSKHRTARASTLTFLTAAEASKQGIGLSASLYSYDEDFYEDIRNGEVKGFPSNPRVTDIKKAHHVSEVTQYSPDGTRYVYGIPAYNNVQKEVVFNTSDPDNTKKDNVNENPDKGLVQYTPTVDNSSGNTKGLNNFFSAKKIPGYAHSYMLTAVLSPDYVDVLGDGITSDDLGTAVQLNYRQQSSQYEWRAPYEKNMARLDQGRYSDPKDSRGSYVWGTKEIWYLHSIVSKTHIALFKTSDRYDSHGVEDENGGISTTDKNTMRKLDRIELYSLLDFFNSPKPTPIKKVIFDYDYSLCQGIPNNEKINESGEPAINKGKLTLKKVYFTYGHSNKGSLSPYQFSYGESTNKTQNPDYDLTKMDRWGNFKEHESDIRNRDYPYVKQGEETNDYASVWCLKEVKLPSGGKINVEYESDDYAYVQDRKAMEMVKIVGAAPSVDASPLIPRKKLYDKGKNHNVLFFKIDPTQIKTDHDVYFKLLKGNVNNNKDQKIDQLYFRFKVNMRPDNMQSKYFEYISGYGTIKSSGMSKDPRYAYVELDEVSQGDVGLTKANIISKSAWQVGLQELRPILYPGSSPKSHGKSAFLGLVNALPTALNVFTGPYQNLRWKKIAQVFSPNESYIRLYSPTMKKKGGGVRVKKILLNDDWANMSSGQSSTEYGQKFEYTYEDGTSTGVASYEPSIGNDENPWRQPEFRTDKIPMGPNLNKYTDIPIGEALFPGASVGYSEVKVTSIANAKSPRSSTGYTLNKFYTAKDFPVISHGNQIQRLSNRNGGGRLLQSIFGFKKRDYQAASQGYVVELNNMHGKPKGVEVYGELNESAVAERIGGSDYYYSTDEKGLANTMPVLNPEGIVEEVEIGREYEVALDMRQNYNRQRSGGARIGADVALPFFPLVVVWVWPEYNDNETMYQSVVTTKIIQKYGVLKEVVAHDYGSKVSTKNELWDKETGQVLLTSTQNEYNDDIYNFTYPAHMAYEGMGMAYKNINYELGTTLMGLTGWVTLPAGKNKFVVGDELLMTKASGYAFKGWVLEINGNNIRIIDSKGAPVTGSYASVKVLRSGRRNMFSNAVGSFVGMSNPIKGVGQSLELENDIVQTSAITYSDEWQGYWDRNYNGETICDTFDVHEDYVKTFIKFFDLYSSGGIDHKRLLTSTNTVLTAMNIEDDCTWFTGSVLEAYLHQICDNNGIEKDSASYYFGYDDQNPDILKLQIVYLDKLGQQHYYDINCGMDYHNDASKAYFTGLDENGDSLFSYQYPFDSFNKFTTSYASSTFGYYDLVGYTDNDTVDYYLSFSCAVYPIILCRHSSNCDYVLGDYFNPYTNGIRGVWRPKETFAFNGDRKYVHQEDSTHIRKDGIIKDYSNFWAFDGSGDVKLSHDNADIQKWIPASTATLYSPEGNGLEEKNALGIYSAQIYGYDHTLVTAVGSNARHRQLAFDNFEDYNYVQSGCVKQEHFDFREGLSFSWQKRAIPTWSQTVIRKYNTYDETAYIRKDTAHSGYYSIAIQPDKSHSVTRLIDLSGITVNVPEDTTLFRLTNADDCVGLFAPDTAKQYVLSAWVHEDGNSNDYNTFENAEVQVEIYENGVVTENKMFNASGMIIDGWQRLEGVFDVPVGSDSIKVSLNNTGAQIAGFDDIRIHPYHGNMKSYVYHNVLLRVIAELDENNYATFYEYDAEGTLVRVKKETEKGIVTIQENRKSVKN